MRPEMTLIYRKYFKWLPFDGNKAFQAILSALEKSVKYFNFCHFFFRYLTWIHIHSNSYNYALLTLNGWWHRFSACLTVTQFLEFRKPHEHRRRQTIIGITDGLFGTKWAVLRTSSWLFDFLDLLWLNNWAVFVGKCRKSVGKKLGLSVLSDRKIVF